MKYVVKKNYIRIAKLTKMNIQIFNNVFIIICALKFVTFPKPLSCACS